MTDDLRAAVTALAAEFARAAIQWQRLAGDYATGAYDAYDIAAQKLRGALGRDTASDAPQGTTERLPAPPEGDGPGESFTGRRSTYYDTAEPEEPA